MLVPSHYDECITEPLAVVVIRQYFNDDENVPFEDVKKTFKFHFANFEELLKDSTKRIYDYVISNKGDFDFSKDFYFRVSLYGTNKSIISGCLNWDYDLFKSSK